jgi:hypothetical protein
MTYAVLDLFCGLGGFSAAFEESDRWAVTTVDIEARFDPDITADVFDLRPSDFETEFDVVLASPPCDVFSLANTRARYWAADEQTPTDPKSRDHVALIHHTVGLIRGLAPTYWVLENPRGRLRWFLDEPAATVTYCQYGESYQKPTDLWGVHPSGLAYRSCTRGSTCHATVRRDDDHAGALANDNRDPAKRAKVPYELSESIRDACEAALDGEVAEQTPLADWTPDATAGVMDR